MKSLVRTVIGLVLVGSAVASAQVTMTLDQEDYTYEHRMVVTVTIPPGTRVEKPRFCFLRDGQSLPKRGHPLWIDFPAFTASQQVQLRAPQHGYRGDEWSPPEEGWWLVTFSWSLLLYDGNRLIARVPFEIAHFMLDLKRKIEELQAKIAARQPVPGSTATPPGSPGGGSSSRGHLRMAAPKDLGAGEVFEAVVTLPGGEPGSATLRWGQTLDLPWEGKAKAPESNDFAPRAMVPPAAGPQNVSVIAPFKAGRFELRLFRGEVLLDVLAVTVKE